MCRPHVAKDRDPSRPVRAPSDVEPENILGQQMTWILTKTDRSLFARAHIFEPLIHFTTIGIRLRASISRRLKSIGPLDKLTGGNQLKGFSVYVSEHLTREELRPSSTNLIPGSVFSLRDPKVSIFDDHQGGSVVANASIARRLLDKKPVPAIDATYQTGRQGRHHCQSADCSE